MADDPPKQPYIYEGIDPAADKSPTEALSDTVRQTAQRASEVFESAKQPGMPLSVLANVAREAPLGSLFAAFVLGWMIGRR